MLHLKLQYFGHLMRRINSLENILMLGKTEARNRRGWQMMRWLDNITDSMDMNLSKLWDIVEDRGAWHASVHVIAKSPTCHKDWITATTIYWGSNLCFSTLRRLLRALWLERRSNQSILKEISPDIHWKDWCWNTNTLATWLKNWLIRKDPDAGKDWRWEEKGTTEDEFVGWHHWLYGHEFEQAPGVGDR